MNDFPKGKLFNRKLLTIIIPICLKYLGVADQEMQQSCYNNSDLLSVLIIISIIYQILSNID